MQAIRDIHNGEEGSLKTTSTYLQRLEVQTTGNLGAALLRCAVVATVQLL
jgi:hypothetical protein